MPISVTLLQADLTFNCPRCARAVIKRGSWFRAVSKFKCEGCRGEARITYDDKLALFAKHAGLIGASTS
jgi:predicted RNA-binding Zn-ribbon protein involved in translation (DUF1610 family)